VSQAQAADNGRWSIRAVEGSDLEALYRLDQQCFPQGIAYSRADLRGFLDQPRSFGLAAYGPDSSLLGFIVAETARLRGSLTGHIITIDVAAQARRGGLGRTLMQQVEERMRLEGAGSIRLEVAEDNPGAQSFYRLLQYQPIGTIRGYYLGRVDAIVMQKALARD
jgi:ribosomal-protein-alanine N-acetyltransferase